MTAPKYGDHETVEVRVRISPQAAAILRRDVQKGSASGTLAKIAGTILTNATLDIDRSRKEVEAERKGRAERPSVAALAKRYTATQISAILRLPYSAVLMQLGKDVDAIVRKRDQREARP